MGTEAFFLKLFLYCLVVSFNTVVLPWEYHQPVCRYVPIILGSETCSTSRYVNRIKKNPLSHIYIVSFLCLKIYKLIDNTLGHIIWITFTISWQDMTIGPIRIIQQKMLLIIL